MSTANLTILICLAVAALIVVAWGKPTRKLMGGLFQRDKKGRMTIVLTPVPKKKRRRRRK